MHHDFAGNDKIHQYIATCSLFCIGSYRIELERSTYFLEQLHGGSYYQLIK